LTGRSELREQLIGLRRQRAAVQTQLNDVRRDMTGQKRSFKRTFSDLERFFPNEEFRTLEEIEGFHHKLSRILDSEFKETEGDLATTYMLLGDEINRTSAKTQSALLEVMEERAVTIDGQTHQVPRPFVCIATENPVGSAGTQPLPDSQLDRFMVRLSIGYPLRQDQIDILKARRYANPLDDIKPMVACDDLLDIQNYLGNVQVADTVLDYIVRLCEETRNSDLVELGVSPRGIIALTRMARACALIRERDYVVPEDVHEVFKVVCAHRLVLRPQARIESITAEDVLDRILAAVPAPSMGQVRGRS